VGKEKGVLFTVKIGGRGGGLPLKTRRGKIKIKGFPRNPDPQKKNIKTAPSLGKRYGRIKKRALIDAGTNYRLSNAPCGKAPDWDL